MIMENVAFAGIIGVPQLILIALVVLLLFGGRKLPELMRGFGKGVRGFKEEMNAGKDPKNEVTSTESKNEA